jgi:hypothetical protein
MRSLLDQELRFLPAVPRLGFVIPGDIITEGKPALEVETVTARTLIELPAKEESE